MEATILALINVSKLKQQLDLEGISHDDFTDNQLELLLTNVVTELMGLSNVPIQATNHKTIVRDFVGDLLELDYYPVKNITSLKIGSKTLTADDYILDDNLGIVYFNSNLSGMLVVEYCCQISDDAISNIVNPLIFDIIKYRLTTNFTTTGVASSVKEGDVQVNYDTNSSLGSLIQGRINDLKSCYSIRIKVL